MAASQLSAYSLKVTVTIADGTLAFGTNVSLERGGVQVANAIADVNGSASFNVAAGSYFVQLNRGSFPVFVYLVDVEKDTSIEYTIWQGLSYSNAYGQIFGPSDFSNSSVTVYSGSQVVSRVTHAKSYPDNSGCFMIQFLPEGNYRLVFNVSGYQGLEEDVFLPDAQFVEVNPTLAPAVQQAPPQPALSAPASVQQYSAIVATLSEGGGPMAGQNVSVQTPAGALSLTTASDGTVSVNAAEPGQYSFSYGNLTASTSVQGNQAQAQPPSQPEQQPAQQPQNNTSSQQPAQQPSGQAGSILPFLAVGGLALLVVIAAAALFFIVTRYGKEKGGAGGSQEAHGHSHGHEHHHQHHHKEHDQKGKAEG
jgi:hypothetical protein